MSKIGKQQEKVRLVAPTEASLETSLETLLEIERQNAER